MIVETQHFISISEDDLKSTETSKAASTELTDAEFRIVMNKMVNYKPMMFYMNKETAESLPESIRNKLKTI